MGNREVIKIAESSCLEGEELETVVHLGLPVTAGNRLRYSGARVPPGRVPLDVVASEVLGLLKRCLVLHVVELPVRREKTVNISGPCY